MTVFRFLLPRVFIYCVLSASGVCLRFPQVFICCGWSEAISPPPGKRVCLYCAFGGICEKRLTKKRHDFVSGCRGCSFAVPLVLGGSLFAVPASVYLIRSDRIGSNFFSSRDIDSMKAVFTGPE